MNGIATATAAKIDEAVLLVIADGECAVPMENPFGGVDLWLEGQAGILGSNVTGRKYLAEGVRLATDDETISVIKFVGNGVVASKVTLNGDISAELLASIVKGLI
jgi:hypothetical protein